VGECFATRASWFVPGHFLATQANVDALPFRLVSVPKSFLLEMHEARRRQLGILHRSRFRTSPVDRTL
jgi:hypothetical protein